MASLTSHIPNTITSLNLVSGVLGVIFSLRGNLQAGFVCMLAAGVFDFCDGLAARLLKAYSDIGKELDSLCDLVSFGVLPSLMLLQASKISGGEGIVPYFAIILAVCSALRLAKFNIDTRQSTDFIGMPTPSGAILAASAACFLECPAWVFPVLALLLGLLEVSEIPFFGMKISKGHKLLDSKRIVFLAAAAAGIVVTIILKAHFSLAFLIIFGSYILINLFSLVLKR